MNSAKHAPLAANRRGQITRRLLWQYLLALVLGAVGVTALGIFGWTVCNIITWQPGDPLYWLLQAVREYILFFWLAAIALSWVGISYYFLNRPLRYLEQIVTAAKQLVLPGGEAIVLPADLAGIQNDMNQAKQQALLASKAAREAEQRKNDLVVYLAHDLKTPMTSIIGYLTLLRDEPELAPAARARYTSIALDKALRLEDLVNEFFEITRFNLTRLELETAPVDLALMLRQMAEEFAPMLAEKQLTCALSLPNALPYRCDGDKMARVFENLLRNAVHYSFAGGQLCISGGSGPGGVCLRFANPGPTIPPEKLERIFQQFYRLDAARQTRTGGAGLGLAIARQILQCHGGAITAASENDTVCFTVQLPPQENGKVFASKE